MDQAVLRCCAERTSTPKMRDLAKAPHTLDNHQNVIRVPVLLCGNAASTLLTSRNPVHYALDDSEPQLESLVL
jgi:hypothetical protein